ncbi:hypothetical protein PTSG_06356 [Salpingoeca rosetta]|uniref:Uncharacterized protein n=1 Tax=Salpingoeca rosetta (strain ATCC 50818 / BSB-021) TaxID=946362 RepID=F2UCN9_SALR5|nr:uncharacterized protein PTSG_06356 [Salpingoeca rosetta]EGD74346.1 hypothetical protein PTSG_06356 [Salpingoeca rosetta]|eukprot:XP_004993246.1 hypothetical protein PTSG_06356 [Salpingoeca rosetta]
MMSQMLSVLLTLLVLLTCAGVGAGEDGVDMQPAIFADDVGNLFVDTKRAQGRVFVNGVDVQVLDERMRALEATAAALTAAQGIQRAWNPNLTVAETASIGAGFNEVVNGIVADSIANVVCVCGETSNNLFAVLSGLVDAYVACFNADDATLKWGVQFGSSQYDRAFGVAMDPVARTVYVFGHSNGGVFVPEPHGLADLVLAAFHRDTGKQLWGVQFGSANTELAQAMVFDEVSRSLFIGGYHMGSLFEAQASAWEGYVARVDSSTGNVTWGKHVQTNRNDYVHAVAVDSRVGLVFAAGTTEGDLSGDNSGSKDVFVDARHVANGDSAWTTQLGSAEKEEDVSLAASTDLGLVFVVFSTQGELYAPNADGAGDVAVVALHSTNGSVAWNTQLGATAADEAGGVAYDASTTTVVITGATLGAMFADQQHHGGMDLFVARLDARTGEVLWGGLYGTEDDDSGRAIAASARVPFREQAAVFVAGETEGALFGLPTAGGVDAFLAILRPDSW